MSVISHNYKFLYLQVPRTGCTSFGNKLVRDKIGIWLPSQDLYNSEKKVIVERKHNTVKELVNIGLFNPDLLRRNGGEYLLVAGTRNPFDSLYSFYSKLKSDYVPLLNDPEAFIHRKPHLKKSITTALNYDFRKWVFKYFDTEESRVPKHMFEKFYEPFPDFILRFENRASDVKNFFRIINYKGSIEYKNINPTTKKFNDYRDVYDSESRQLVEQIFKPDLEMFSYDF